MRALIIPYTHHTVHGEGSREEGLPAEAMSMVVLMASDSEIRCVDNTQKQKFQKRIRFASAQAIPRLEAVTAFVPRLEAAVTNFASGSWPAGGSGAGGAPRVWGLPGCLGTQVAARGEIGISTRPGSCPAVSPPLSPPG